MKANCNTIELVFLHVKLYQLTISLARPDSSCQQNNLASVLSAATARWLLDVKKILQQVEMRAV